MERAVYVGGKLYLAEPRNYAFMLNVDWFPPFIQIVSLYCVGAIYMVSMNLTRSEKLQPENAFLVGVIPEPNEPKLNINASLQPLELNSLWENGVSIKAHDSSTTQMLPYCTSLCGL